MASTPDLIESLVANATPVRPLRAPLLRAGFWLALAGAVIGVLVLLRGVRPDLSTLLAEPRFVVGMVGALVTGAASALAAFQLSLPDRPSAWLLLPLPPALVWLGTIVYGCLTNWVDVDPQGLRFGTTAQCLLTLLLVSGPLYLSQWRMLRQAGPQRPTLVSMTGGLAIAAITAAALMLLHSLDATVLVLIANFGLSLLFLTLGITQAGTLESRTKHF